MEVKLFATLREGRGKSVAVDWVEGMDGYALFNAIGIDKKDVAIFLINGVHSSGEDVLQATDAVSLFPPVGGG